MSGTRGNKPAVRTGELLFLVLFVLFAVFLLSQAPDQVKWFKRTKWSSQPALWSMIGVGSMVLFGGLHLATRFRRDKWREELGESLVWLRSLEFAGWFMMYVFLVPVIGYLPMTLILAPVLTYRVGYRSKGMLWASVGAGLVIVLVFKSFLQVKIPGAMLYEYLPGSLRSFMILYL